MKNKEEEGKVFSEDKYKGERRTHYYIYAGARKSRSERGKKKDRKKEGKEGSIIRYHDEF